MGPLSFQLAVFGPIGTVRKDHSRTASETPRESALSEGSAATLPRQDIKIEDCRASSCSCAMPSAGGARSTAKIWRGQARQTNSLTSATGPASRMNPQRKSAHEERFEVTGRMGHSGPVVSVNALAWLWFRLRSVFRNERLRTRTATRSTGEAADHKADDQKPCEQGDQQNPSAVQEQFPR